MGGLSGVSEGTMRGCLEQVRGPWRVEDIRGGGQVAEGHHMGRRPPVREAGVPPAGTSVRRGVYAIRLEMEIGDGN